MRVLFIWQFETNAYYCKLQTFSNNASDYYFQSLKNYLFDRIYISAVYLFVATSLIGYCKINTQKETISVNHND